MPAKSIERRMMPAQKPHRSKQNYRTPENFIQAVKQRLGIQEFAIDFAADRFNSQALLFWDERIDALQQSVTAWARQCKNGWGWLNPSYTDIKPWAACCMETAALGGSLAFLVPAAVGSNWFRDYVDHNAYVLLLNGRLPEMGINSLRRTSTSIGSLQPQSQVIVQFLKISGYRQSVFPINVTMKVLASHNQL